MKKGRQDRIAETLTLSSLKKIIPVNLPDGELCMKKRRQIGNWRKRSG